MAAVGGVFQLISDGGWRARHEFMEYIKEIRNRKQLKVNPVNSCSCFKRIGVMEFSFRLSDVIII